MRTLEELYRAYRDDVYRYLYSLTRDAAQAEDLLSETFLQALQNAASYRGEAGEKTWLFGIARNLWLRALRKRRPTVSFDDLLGLYVEDTLAETAARRALLDRVRGVPYEEIAKELGISAGSARVIDHRARQWLKETLRKEELL